MARVTVRMDEALWQRARNAAAHDGRSLSRFVAESLELHLGRLRPLSESYEQAYAEPATGTANENTDSATGGTIRDAL